jgi:hypothetical protein
MSKIHIALVGGQPMPIHVGIEEFKADKLILVHSKESKELAEGIQQSVDLPCELQPFESVDYPKIYQAAEKLLGKCGQSETIINISGGTKPWTVAFVLLAQQCPNTSIIYVDQNNVGYNLTTSEKKSISSKLDTQTILRYNNYPLGSYANFKDITEADLKAAKDVEKIRKSNLKVFKELTIDNKEVEYKPTGRKETARGSYVEWDKKANTAYMVLKNKWGVNKLRCSSPHVIPIVFNSGWFEVQVAEMLSQWEKAQEVIVNATFDYSDKDTKNEIDVIVNMGNKLLFVECKTQIKNLTDLDKFTTAAKKYGGMGVKMLFVTKEWMNNKAEEKCRENRIIPFSIQSGGLIDPQKALFALLNNEMSNINTK